MFLEYAPRTPPRLLDELRDGLLQVVDARAHIVDAVDDGVRHGLEAALHLLPLKCPLIACERGL